MTPDEILKECFTASNGDAEAAHIAANLLSSRTPEELQQMVDTGGALSLNGNECLMRRWVDEFGITRIVSVPMSREEQRSANRSRMSAMLSILDAEITRMATNNGAALSLAKAGTWPEAGGEGREWSLLAQELR